MCVVVFFFTFRLHGCATHKLRTVVTHVAMSVCVFVGHYREPYKKDKSIEMPFAVWAPK